MGTAATPTLTSGPNNTGLGLECEFTLLLDETDASGLMTVDLTDYFSYINAASLSGSLAATGYVVEVQKPAFDDALTSTNLVLGFYEAATDGAALDAKATTNFSAVITGLTLTVSGKPVAVTSWA